MHTQQRRYDIYAFIHKALRGMMADALLRAGRFDPDDAAERHETLAAVDTLLDCCALHLQDENEFVHSAIEARCPGGSARTGDDHAEHVQAIGRLRALTTQLREAAPWLRAETAALLYQELGLFVGENYAHMHVEETHNNELLWQHYSDAEIMDINAALVASLPPQQVQMMLGWMVRHLNPAERAQLLGRLQATLPPPAFEGILASARGLLTPREYDKLMHALGLVEAQAA